MTSGDMKGSFNAVLFLPMSEKNLSEEVKSCMCEALVCRTRQNKTTKNQLDDFSVKPFSSVSPRLVSFSFCSLSTSLNLADVFIKAICTHSLKKSSEGSGDGSAGEDHALVMPEALGCLWSTWEHPE